jgi:hypothetical protein
MKNVTALIVAATLCVLIPLLGNAGESNDPVLNPKQYPKEKDLPGSPIQIEVETELKSKKFETLDKNGDGYLSKKEVAAVPDLLRNETHFDENSDGNISPSEFKKYVQQSAPSEMMEEGAKPLTGGEKKMEMPISPMQEQVEKEIR